MTRKEEIKELKLTIEEKDKIIKKLNEKIKDLETSLNKGKGFYSNLAELDTTLSDDICYGSERNIYNEISDAKIALFKRNKIEANSRVAKIRRYAVALKSVKEAEQLLYELNILKNDISDFKVYAEKEFAGKPILKSYLDAAANYTTWLDEAISHCEEILK